MASPHIEVRDRFISKRKGDTCYGLGEWRRYAAGIWGAIPDWQIKKEVQCLATKTPNLSVTNGVVISVTELIRHQLAVSDFIFDSNPNIIAFADCVLDLQTWATVPHCAAHYSTSKLPFPYDPTATLPEWDRFLKALPHPEFMQRFAGYCMTSETKYETALWLWGPPGGGKSTFIEALCAMLGAKACVLGLSEIERSQFALSQLPGRTLAVSTELPARIVRSANIINAIISGESIPIERKYINPYTIRPHAKIIWGMNQLPAVGTEGVGMFRRIVPVHFAAISETERDPLLKEAIMKSPMAVANWAINGWRDVQASNSLNIPPELIAARDQYREHNDLTLNFVNEMCDLDLQKRAKTTSLYVAYKDWVNQNGYRAVSIRSFTADLDRLGFINVKPHNVSYWTGLALASDDSALDSTVIQ